MAGPTTTRRAFLRQGALLTGGLAGATVLGACAGKTVPSRAGPAIPVATTGSTRPVRQAARERFDGPESPSGLLRISNRPDSIGVDTVRQYQLATGVTVDYYEDIVDDDVWLTANARTLASNDDIGSDLDVLGDPTTSQLIQTGRLERLDHDNIPNLSHLRRELANPAFDPDRAHSLPWVAGMAGLAYNPNLTLRPITGVPDLFDPAYRGRVTMLSDFRDGLGMIMASQGNPPARATPVTVTAAAEAVRVQHALGQIGRFTGNADFSDLVAGAIAIAQVRSGDMAALQAANRALVFVVPAAGSTLFARDMVLPITTHNQVAGESWMNWIYDRARYASLLAQIGGTGVLSGLDPALARIRPGLVADPIVNPPASTWARLSIWPPLDARTAQRYAALYAGVTG
jgi:spermidine/putrescine transport system substrate-binding protein